MKQTRRVRRERECGLGFAWQLPESSRWALFAAVAIAAVLAVVFFNGLRVRVMPPPRVIERRAGAVLIPNDEEGRGWAILAQEAGPFPSRFELSQWPGSRELEAAVWPRLAARGERRPKLHEWPVEPPGVSPPSVAAKGQRVMPAVDWQPEEPARTTDPRVGWRPVLQRLTVLPEDVWPVAPPDFPGEVPPEMAAAPWRFLVRIGPDGRVDHCLTLNPSSDPGGARLEAWLRGLRFGRKAAAAGWIAVGVHFNRQP